MSNLERKNSHLNEAIEILDQHLRRCKYDVAVAANTLSHVYGEFINEELMKCMVDPRYYLENYHVIKTKNQGFKTLYPFFDAQEIIYSEIMSLLAAGKPAKCLIDKARQQGSSTLAEGIIFQHTVFNEAVNTLIVAQNPAQSDYLFSMSLLALENLPWWMQPRVRYRSKARYLVFDSDNPEMKGLNSTIYVDNANKLCLCPGTMVETRRGLVPIEAITPGDYVFDPACRPVEVVAAIARRSPEKRGKKIMVWHNAGFPISGTNGHPLMTTNGLRGMQDIEKGDSLVLPYRKITSEKIIPLAQMTEWAQVRLKSRPNPIANREWGFLCGLYLAEGTVGKDNGRCVSFGLHTRELHLAERVSRACGVEMGKPMIKGNALVVRIHSSWLGTWLSQQFGDNNEKHIPDWVFGCGPEFCVGLLEGAVLGDGHKCKNRNDIIFVTVRPMLALKIRELALALGFGLGGIMKSKTRWAWKGEKKVGVAYRVEFGGDVAVAIRLALGMSIERCKTYLRNRVRWAWIPGQNAVSVEVKSVQDCDIDVVYDIQVDSEDHLYTLPACVTHNTGVSVGRTIHCSHLSELSDWDNADILTEQIFPTMSGKNVIAILESTARGADGFWYDFWTEAVESWGEDDWEWKPIFVEWFRCIDYSMPIEDKSRFVRTEEEAKISDKVLRSSGYNLADEQLNWRRIKRKETIKIKGDDTSFLQEFPLTWQESFQASGLCAFPKDLLYQIMNTTCCDPLWYGELEYSHGAAQEVKLHLTATFDEAERSRTGKVIYRRDRVIPAAKKYGGRFRVWEQPEAGAAYYVAGDPAHGLEGGDFSCAQIIRIGHGCEPDVQVAEWNGWINPTAFGHVLVGLAKWYNGAELSLELNAVGELTYMVVFRTLEYSNLFRWKHYDKVKNYWSDYMAWLTTAKTRDLIISNMRERIMEKTVVLYSQELLTQMLHFTADEEGSKFQGQATNDDRVMAIQICLWCAHDSDYGRQAAMVPKTDGGHKKYYVIDDVNRVVFTSEQKDEAYAAAYVKTEARNVKGEVIPTHAVMRPGWSVAHRPNKKDFNNSDFSPVHDKAGPRAQIHAYGVPAESIRLDNLQDWETMRSSQDTDRSWMEI